MCVCWLFSVYAIIISCASIRLALALLGISLHFCYISIWYTRRGDCCWLLHHHFFSLLRPGCHTSQMRCKRIERVQIAHVEQCFSYVIDIAWQAVNSEHPHTISVVVGWFCQRWPSLSVENVLGGFTLHTHTVCVADNLIISLGLIITKHLSVATSLSGCD